MMNLTVLILLNFLTTFVVPFTTPCDKKPFCSYCEWESWSECSQTCGGGDRFRQRHLRVKPEWSNHNIQKVCGTNKTTLSEITECDAICFNGGKYAKSLRKCICSTLYFGTCCETDREHLHTTRIHMRPVLSKTEASIFLRRSKRDLSEECTEGGDCTYEEADEVFESSRARVCNFFKNWKCGRAYCSGGSRCYTVVEDCSRLSRYQVACTDVTPPSMTCPEDIYQTAPEHQTSATVYWSGPTATDARDGAINPTMTSGLSPWSSFPEGTTVVTYSASDTSGNTATCSFNVYVTVIRCPSPSISSPGTVQCSNGGSNTLGTECTYTCPSTGHILHGKRDLECLYFGFWDHESPKCSRINCGHPGSLKHGHVIVTNTEYNGVATYSCNSGFILKGDNVRVCQANGTWSGTFPICTVDSCSSFPCEGGGTCLNMNSDFTCICPMERGGKHCEKDLSPPVLKSCPSGQIHYTTTPTLNVTWTMPEWEASSEIQITSRYNDTATAVLPLGLHTVIYTAVRTTNDMSSSCNFTIDIRPHRCAPLNKSSHSVLLCNGWDKEYFSLCKQICEKGFATTLGRSQETNYICGSDGKWYPTETLPECIENSLSLSGSDQLAYEDCMDQRDRVKLSEMYILSMKDFPYAFLCNEDRCKARNVNVIC